MDSLKPVTSQNDTRMKTLIAFAVLLGALTLRAQTTTNIAYRIQVETVTAGVTNTVNTAWRFDALGTKRDQVNLNGILYAYGVYCASLAEGETPLSLGLWLKRQHFALIENYANQKQAADNSVIAQKIATLLIANSDLLSNADMNNLQQIAAKLP